MSHSFASITADILVRKGHAKPWQPEAWSRDPEPEPQQPLVGAAMPAPAACNTRRCTIRLSECEYQRLGIVAVKTDTSRQQVLRRAVEAFLTASERDFGSCGCLSGKR